MTSCRSVPSHRVVVLWDADGVLQRVPAGEESMRGAVEGLVGDVDAFLLDAYDAERPALEGKVRWVDVLPTLLGRWGAAHAVDDVLHAWLSIDPVPEARAEVSWSRGAGAECYLATNQDARRKSWMLEHLGYAELVDGAFFSCDLGVAKPDPDYYEAVLRALGAPADRVLVVDDNRLNVESARSLGMAAEVWSYREPVEVLRAHLAAHLTRHGAGVG